MTDTFAPGVTARAIAWVGILALLGDLGLMAWIWAGFPGLRVS